MILECNKGYYRLGEKCNECEKNSWSNPASGTEVTECTKCTGGQVTLNTTASSIDECGMYSCNISQSEKFRIFNTKIVPHPTRK